MSPKIRSQLMQHNVRSKYYYIKLLQLSKYGLRSMEKNTTYYQGTAGLQFQVKPWNDRSSVKVLISCLWVKDSVMRKTMNDLHTGLQLKRHATVFWFQRFIETQSW